MLKEIALEHRGLVLLTGITGSGKSSTLAAMISYANQHRAGKIVTIEDPIEFLHRDIKSIVIQRELGTDTESFAKALRAALQPDPDIILVGEMRDKETIDIALKAAETGHLVFSTVHTTDAPKTISRLVGAFEASEQYSTRMRLAETLKAAISQRLLPRRDGQGRLSRGENNTPAQSTTLILKQLLSSISFFADKGICSAPVVGKNSLLLQYLVVTQQTRRATGCRLEVERDVGKIFVTPSPKSRTS